MSGSINMLPWTSDGGDKAVAPPLPAKQEQEEHSHPRPFALMSEPRCLNATPFVLQNALEMLSNDVKVVLLHSTGNTNCIEQWIQENPVLFEANKTGRFIHYIETHMNVPKNYIVPHHYGTHRYSTMYTNISFWQGLRQYGNVVPTIQADTLICSNHTPNWSKVHWWHFRGTSYGPVAFE